MQDACEMSRTLTVLLPSAELVLLLWAFDCCSLDEGTFAATETRGCWIVIRVYASGLV